MSIEAALTTWLSEQAAVQKLIDARIYPQSIPQAASFPAVTYYRTGQETVKSFGGLTGVSRAALTVDCWALSYTAAKSLADTIRGNKSTPGLDGYAGTIGGVKIQACFCIGAVDFRERPVHGEEAGVPHVALDFEFWFEDV